MPGWGQVKLGPFFFQKLISSASPSTPCLFSCFRNGNASIMKALGNLHGLDKRCLKSTLQVSPETWQRGAGCFSQSSRNQLGSHFLLLSLSLPFRSASSVFPELPSPGCFLFCVSSRYCCTALSTAFSTSLLLSLTSSASSGSPPSFSPTFHNREEKSLSSYYHSNSAMQGPASSAS